MNVLTIFLLALTVLAAPLTDDLATQNFNTTIDTSPTIKRADRWTFPLTFIEDCVHIIPPQGAPKNIRYASIRTTTFREPNGNTYSFPTEHDIMGSEHVIIYDLPGALRVDIGPMSYPGTTKVALMGGLCDWHAGDHKPSPDACGGCELKVPQGEYGPYVEYGAMPCTGHTHRERQFDCWWKVGGV
ncbi:hypothetical protein CC80DRAFT_532498 [Byssothecium circinans]|uniref:Uncharacterized protein n=1 Tax=Byssothecium circinans TaxID=147558 RepID=A0A6A5U7S0_9PLEO|nr:hypothetical protein CC80DRAFT_532498 [Byssothecium circinans]